METKNKTPKKTIVDFKKIYDKKLQENLNSPYEYIRNNAIYQTICYCKGYFESDNSDIYKILDIISRGYFELKNI
jgi:hypothetical protein